MPNHLPTPDYPRFHLACPVTELAKARRFTMSFLDRFVNALEFQAFADMNPLFATS